MRLEVENFAKIKKADIEINGITVIAGENDTGKSTIGKILYCLYTAFHNLNEKILEEKKRNIGRVIFENYKGTTKEVNKIFDIPDILLKTDNLSHVSIETILNKQDICDVDDELIDKILEYLNFDNEELKGLIVKKIFNDEFNNQIKPAFNDKLITNIKLFIKEEKIEVEFDRENDIVKSDIDLNNDGILIDNPFLLDDIKKDNSSSKSVAKILDFLFLDEKIYRHDLRLTEALSKSLSQPKSSLIDEAILKRRLDKFLDIIVGITKGDFHEQEAKFTFLNSVFNKEIELSNLSTGVKSFAIILKLLENKDIADNSIIILDEPEVHLHPKWQLIYAEILILLQKEFNLNIVLSTHSPYFIRAIQVYSAKYKIANKCKYYLSNLDDESCVNFEDATLSIDKIYEKLSNPLQLLMDVKSEVDFDD
ncbi:MAG: ATP-binding protein [Erysipelotrichaceae bacterium]|nr:ATP-binding protein [Erysipelotrichaceae bacterium]